METEYAEIIVSGIINNNKLVWYIAPKEYFIMDYQKYGISPKERFGIEILSEENKQNYIEEMKRFEMSKEEIREELSKFVMMDDFDKIEEYIPNIIINFDKKEFISMYPEMISFEEYVPDNWVGTYTNNIFKYIDKMYEYWYFKDKSIFDL